MAKIKSALEIALEKTESVQVDRGSIGQFEAKQKGKKLANDFLAGTVESLKDDLVKGSADEQASLKQGLFDVLISRISLPQTKDDVQFVERAGQGLLAIVKEKRFADIISQFNQLMSQYLDETAQYEEAIMRQYAPKLRQKEEALSRRMGRPVKLDPFQDPEFAAFYNQNISGLKANYETAVEQVREEAKRLFE
jgi:hypothetical protein